MEQQEDTLLVEGPASSVSDLFLLGQDVRDVYEQLSSDSAMAQMVQELWGLRVLRQEPWQCTISFVLSACNNITRLTGMLQRLSEHYGEPITVSESQRYAFPTPEALALASEADLRACGLGYRAPYVKAIAEQVIATDTDLQAWSNLETGVLAERLQAFPGLGKKVAACVMLFAYQRYEIFPVDVWIERLMRDWYFKGRKVSHEKIQTFARKHFGPHCGWAQQFIYAWAQQIGKQHEAT